MTLGFMTKWSKGGPTHFVEKIWAWIEVHSTLVHSNHIPQTELVEKYYGKPKIHSIRKGSRWGKGMSIHMVTGDRTPDRYQFMPTLECISVQEFKFDVYTIGMTFAVFIDGRELTRKEATELAINDGFESLDDFAQWFKKPFEGQLIHWTDKRY